VKKRKTYFSNSKTLAGRRVPTDQMPNWHRSRQASYLQLVNARIPEIGATRSDVLTQLEAHRINDLRWKEGRAFSLVYSAGAEALELAKDAYGLYSSENMLNLDAFPSLRKLQTDVMSMVTPLLGGDHKTVGVFTSGGTESILTAVHGARAWGRANGIKSPKMILPTTAHAAFSKAAAYFDVESIRVPVGPDFRANPDAMRAAIDSNTIMMVGSAPAYPQGVIDPITTLGSIAESAGLLFHVDACMGFTLPWLEQLGEVTTPWNFSVPGVTSMSCDLHKFGYTAKGASVLMHRDKGLRKHQFFVTDDWLGGLYGSPALLGTRSGGGLASAWAVFHHLGADGYRRLAAEAIAARRAIQQGVTTIEGLSVRGEPEATLLAFGASNPSELDIFAVADALFTRHGWYVDRQTPPDSLHCTVNAIHKHTAEEFLHDLRNIVAELRNTNASGDRSKAYGTIE
jgi:sphinganine-1-phosphate aldolase